MTQTKEISKNQQKTGSLALLCAQFFMQLSENCFQVYQNIQKHGNIKTKQIKKNEKQKKKLQKKKTEDSQKGEKTDKMKILKKPLTPYILYFQESKARFLEKYPNLSISDITKLIAKQWKQADESVKRNYLQQAEQQRNRYKSDLKQFKQKSGDGAENNEMENQENQKQSANMEDDEKQHMHMGDSALKPYSDQQFEDADGHFVKNQKDLDFEQKMNFQANNKEHFEQDSKKESSGQKQGSKH